MSKGSEVISLGSYKLDVEEMLLSRDGEKVILEPKVLEVLLYFIENKARYITMDELHEKLWQGRIVSDAAVRRIISKLRILFNDDHKAPSYLKSLNKRGYKLICSVSHTSNNMRNSQFDHLDSSPSIMANNNDNSFPNTISPETLSTNNKESNSPNKGKLFSVQKKLLIAIIAFIFLFSRLIFTSWEFQGTPSYQTTPVVQTEIISSFPGEKLSIAQSPNGEYIAFSGKISDSSGFQIYIKHTSENDFHPLTYNANMPNTLVFSSDNKALFFIDVKEEKVSINKIDLSKSDTNVEILLNNYLVVADMFSSPEGGIIYFSGRKKIEEPIFIYSYNLSTSEVKQVTTGSQKQLQDLVGSISPNGGKIAILRYFEFENRNEIRIVDLNSKEILYRRHQDNNVYDIQWLDDARLLLLDEKQLLQINYKDKVEFQLLGESHQIWYMTVTSDHHVLAIKNKKSSRIFFEQKLPLSIFTNQQILNVQNNTYALKYQTNQSEKLVLKYDAGVTILGKIDTSINEFSSYIKTEHDLVAVDSSTENPLELIKTNHRFALFNSKSNIIDYISSEEEFIGDATFSEDELSILFTVKSYDQWLVKRYDIIAKTSELLFEGYRFIRTYGEDYILGTASGHLFLYDNVTNQQIDLSHSLSLDINTRWDVHRSNSEGNIYWSSHDLLETTFHQLNIKDLNNMIKSEQKFDYSKVRPFFSINPEGTRLLYGQQPAIKADIVLLTISPK